MLVVDSSVWTDFFNDAGHPAVEMLQQLLDHGEVRIVFPAPRAVRRIPS